MSDITPFEQKIANHFADEMQKDLEQFKNSMSRSLFNSQFSGVFMQDIDGSISIVKPKPFLKP